MDTLWSSRRRRLTRARSEDDEKPPSSSLPLSLPSSSSVSKYSRNTCAQAVETATPALFLDQTWQSAQWAALIKPRCPKPLSGYRHPLSAAELNALHAGHPVQMPRKRKAQVLAREREGGLGLCVPRTGMTHERGVVCAHALARARAHTRTHTHARTHTHLGSHEVVLAQALQLRSLGRCCMRHKRHGSTAGREPDA